MQNTRPPSRNNGKSGKTKHKVSISRRHYNMIAMMNHLSTTMAHLVRLKCQVKLARKKSLWHPRSEYDGPCVDSNGLSLGFGKQVGKNGVAQCHLPIKPNRNATAKSSTTSCEASMFSPAPTYEMWMNGANPNPTHAKYYYLKWGDA